MTTISELQAAIEAKNWSLANEYLQQIINRKSLENTESEIVLNLAIQSLKKSDFQQRWLIAKELPKLGKIIIPPLIEILEDETIETEIRWFVGRILSNFQESEIIISLAKLVQKTEDEELALMASKALASMGEIAIQPLSNLLPQPEYQLLAAKALSIIRYPQIIQPLLGVVNADSPEVRVIAIEALGSFQDRRIMEVLMKATQDTHSLVRKEAAKALGISYNNTNTKNVVSCLKPLLLDIDLLVCLEAAKALGRIGTVEAIDILFEVLKLEATPNILKLKLVRVLSWVENDQAIEYLGLILIETSLKISPEILAEIIIVLGRIFSPDLKIKATEILINFFHQTRNNQTKNIDSQIKQVLATSLGELGQNSALEILQILAIDSDKKVRLHAKAAVKRLTTCQN